jgi:hypothetical protein
MLGAFLLRRPVAWTGAAALALCVPAPALGAPKTASATGKALILLPVSVVKLQDMDFGNLSVGTTAGTAVLEPNADTLSTTGGVVAIGGVPHSADFAGSAQSSAVVNIKLPNKPTTLTRVTGTETMTLDSFTLQGLSKRSIAKAQSFTFRVGGTLHVAANQVEGVYVGTFTVTVQYP